MRPLRPNHRGIIVPTTPPRIKTGGDVNALVVPSKALHQVDRLLRGETPEILVIRSQGGIGDVLMTTPTVKAISKKYKCQVTYATDMTYLEGALPKVLEGNPYIKEVIPWRGIAFQKFDAVINLTCPCVAHEKPLAKPINRIDLFARHAGIPAEDKAIDYYIRDEELEWAKEYLRQRNLDKYKLILVQPSSSTTSRDAPVDKMKQSLVNVLSLEKKTRAIVITHETDNKKSNWNFPGVTVLNNEDCRRIAAIMHFSDLVICPDSAVLHIASALQKKTVTLFGPTDPNARVNYHPEAVAIWPGKELQNYPCWYENPGDGYMCWKRLEQDSITECSLALLNDFPLPMSRGLVTFGDYKFANKFYQVL